MCINKKDDYLGGGYQTVDETCKADAGVRN